LGQELQAVHTWQPEVSHQHLFSFWVNGGQGILGTFKGTVFYAAQAQCDADGLTQIGIVFDQENLERCDGGHGLRLN
jgi:hypothetical protein